MLGLNTECRSKQKKVIACKFVCNKKKNIKRKQMLQAAVNRRAVSANFEYLGWAAKDFVSRSWLVASNYCYCSKYYYQNDNECGWTNQHHQVTMSSRWVCVKKCPCIGPVTTPSLLCAVFLFCPADDSGRLGV